MNKKVYIYDPTTGDEISRVRGIGRYLQVLKENLHGTAVFTSELSLIPYDSIFLNPFFDLLKPPLVYKRIAKYQIAVIHDLVPLKYARHFPTGIRGSLFITLNKIFLKTYDTIITDSEASKKDIIKFLGIPARNITVIYPTLGKSFFESTEKKSHLDTELMKRMPAKYVLYVGDATWNKNLVNLAKAIKEINVTAVFVGKIFDKKNELSAHPWLKELHEFLKETHNDKRFYFPGFVSDEELITLYRRASANILVSRDEGFGFSYFEAAALGVPSLLADIPVFHETAGDTALFANPDDPISISNQIGELYFNPEKAKKLGEKAKKRIRQFYPDEFRKSLLSLFSKTV